MIIIDRNHTWCRTKKQRLHFFLLFIFSGIFFSCKKSFLDIVDNTEVTRQNYITSLNAVEEYLRGTYGMFNQYIMFSSNSVYPELSADNLKPLASPPQMLMPQYSWTQQKTSSSAGYITIPADVNIDYLWKSSYLVIRSCDLVIEYADNYKNEDPLKAKQLKGEAFALRALLHFMLVNTFAQTYSYTADASHPGVPYITNSDITVAFSRQTVAEVYSNMINDLTSAIQLMSSSTVEIKRFNQLAAKALLTRVYLFKGAFAEAKAMATEVMSSAALSTINDGYPDVMFTGSPTKKTEVLLQATPGDVFSTSFIGRYLRGNNTRFLATADIANLLQENQSDIRSKWITSSPMGWNVTKFPKGVAGLRAVPEADYYQPVIRSSEMFLTAAEACVKTGDENSARIFLNEIRKRADPLAATVTASGAALLDLIYKERRKELAFEGLRMFDLQRWNAGVHRQDVLRSEWSTLPYPSNKAIAPIPLNDVTLAGLTQNTGY